MRGNYWKLTAGIALLSFCTLAAVAQAPDGPPPGPPPDQAGQPGPPAERGPNPDRQLKMLTRLLTLTTDQQTGVKAVLDQSASQMKALRAKQEAAEGNENREGRRGLMEQARQIREETSTKITALLDEPQKKTFADWNAKREDQMQRRRGGDPGDRPPPPPPNGAPPPNAEL